MSITILTKDGVERSIPEEIAFKSSVIKGIIEDSVAGDSLPLDITEAVLQKIVEYYTYHINDPPLEKVTDAENTNNEKKEKTVLGEWDSNFIELPKKDLFDLINSAYYLNFESLVNVISIKIANQICDYSVEQLQDYFEFGPEDKMTPEEIEQVKKDNEWCF